eukprot:scaffold66003_cov63-Phaeocystis_antarctica.AAC.6
MTDLSCTCTYVYNCSRSRERNFSSTYDYADISDIKPCKVPSAITVHRNSTTPYSPVRERAPHRCAKNVLSDMAAPVCAQELGVYFCRERQHAVTAQEASRALEDLALVALHLARGACDGVGRPAWCGHGHAAGFHSRRASVA